MTLIDKELQKEMNRQILEVARTKNHPLHIEQGIRPFYSHWAQSYYAFLTAFLAKGFQIQPIENYSPESSDSKTLFLRHDIHQVDIPGALCMMDMERKLGIRSTYYITWNYRKSDRENRDDYLLLKKFGGDDFEFGLHESVWDEYIFQNHLDGNEDPEKTKAVATSILEDSQLKSMAAESFFAKDANGVLKYPTELPEPLRKWTEGALAILKERMEDFRQHWGQCNSVHSHGGYSVVAIRKFFDMCGTSAFYDQTDNSSKVGMYFLSQFFRAVPQEFRDSCSIQQFAYEAFARTNQQMANRAVEIRDSRKCLADEFWNKIQDGLATPVPFTLIHPSVWSSGQYNPLADKVLETYKAPEDQPKPGHALYALYRTALNQCAVEHFADVYGENWTERKDAKVQYGYEIGNFDKRAGRVIAALEKYNLLKPLENGTMIDLAGGAGTISSYIATHHPFKHVHIMDLAQESLDFQGKVYQKLGWDSSVSLEQSFFSNWTAPSEPVDILMSYGAFEFMPSDKEIRWIFTEVGKAIKPGGVFIANLWNHHYRNQGYSRAPYVQYLPTQKLRLLAAKLLGKKPNPYFRSISHKRWHKEMALAGFEDIKILFCQNTAKGFRFTDVTPETRNKQTHIWVVATKK